LIPNLYEPLVFDSYKIHKAIYASKLKTTATLVIVDEDRNRDYNYIYANKGVNCKINNSQGITPSPRCSLEITKQILREVISQL
jgi:spore coat polysaccharide biosynthesis predicted glycosyltransferase SpsG